ncbi:NUDIX hydrolase [Cohnella fermenti]|uniref:NUDIX domain-containing protein n=1 Tax=Cohnella fermenti TaxID=2565925 RepID=A0A4S4BSI3_9BACL|nr:NUDIX domain-containing protein [Cohnella fermenti]THF78011.1 NUDIX domain-containing protein [Cohnella fermenti]
MAEKFDIYDERGYGIGTAERRDVHALGLWHRSFHCWLARRAEERTTRILFQRRSAGKDTNPDCFDITVAGHLSAGETVRDAAREMDEEIGWSVPFESLRFFGAVQEEGEGTVRSVPFVDRETSYVYGCLTDLAMDSFRLQREEVSGLYEADADELISLMLGERESVLAAGVAYASEQEEALTPAVAEVRADLFVPRERSYYVDVFRFLAGLAWKESVR